MSATPSTPEMHLKGGNAPKYPDSLFDDEDEDWDRDLCDSSSSFSPRSQSSSEPSLEDDVQSLSISDDLAAWRYMPSTPPQSARPHSWTQGGSMMEKLVLDDASPSRTSPREGRSGLYVKSKGARKQRSLSELLREQKSFTKGGGQGLGFNLNVGEERSQLALELSSWVNSSPSPYEVGTPTVLPTHPSSFPVLSPSAVISSSLPAPSPPLQDSAEPIKRTGKKISYGFIPGAMMRDVSPHASPSH